MTKKSYVGKLILLPVSQFSSPPTFGRKYELISRTEMIQRDAQENWQKTVDEITALGDRLQEAAQTAWDILMGKDSSGTK